MATHLTDPAPTCTAPGTLRPGRYAAIDIGTVTCRMLVADIDEAGALHELRREYAITNLGEGVDASGVLRPEAMQPTCLPATRPSSTRASRRTAAASP